MRLHLVGMAWCVAFTCATAAQVEAPLEARTAIAAGQAPLLQAPRQASDDDRWITCARGGDPAALAEARAYLEQRLAEELRDPAHLQRSRHQRMLVAAADAGSLTAAARLVELGMWDAMRGIDTDRPVVAAWRTAPQTVGGLTAAQVYAQLRLHGARSRERQEAAHPAQEREQWFRQVGEMPLRDPMLLAEAAWLCGTIEPKLPVRADQYAQQMLVAMADDSAFAGEDLLLMEGRGLAVARYCWYMDEEGRTAAHAIFAGADALCAARGFPAGQAVNLLIRAQLRDPWWGRNNEQCIALLEEAEGIFAKLGDAGRQGRCLGRLANIQHWDRRNQEVDWAKLIKTYREAEDLCRKAEDWSGLGWVAETFAECLQSRNSQLADDWREIAAAYADAAAAFARDDDNANRAFCLYSQANSLSPDHCRTSDWHDIVALYRQAEVCFADSDNAYMHIYNLCALGEALGMIDDARGAKEAIQHASEVIRSRASYVSGDLMRRVANDVRAYAK